MKRNILLLGGIKAPEIVPKIREFVEERKFTAILIGGTIAYTFLKARGEQIGGSPFFTDLVEPCRRILADADAKGTKILLPVDHLASFKLEANVTIKMVRRDEEIPEGMTGFDIGMETIQLYSSEIREADVVVWHGPMGAAEIETFSGGTLEIGRAVAGSSAVKVVSGGSLKEFLRRAGLISRMDQSTDNLSAALDYLN